MNFEEIEKTWSAQKPAGLQIVDTAGLERFVTVETRRRRRMQEYGIFLSVILLVVLPLITIGNFRYQPPVEPTWYWLRFVGFMGFVAACLVANLRALWRLGVWSGKSDGSVRDRIEAQLAQLKEEMRETKRLVWVMLPFGVLLLLIMVASYGTEWRKFWWAGGFSMGLMAIVSLVYWRHYRVHLMPAREQLERILQELS